MLHKDSILGDRHPIHNWSVADATAKAALVLASTDVGKVLYQVDTGEYQILASVGPAVWSVITGTEAASGGKEVLTADRTYYVRTDGSDSNTGQVDTAGGAFLTLQKALNVVMYEINASTYNVTIQLADGTCVGRSKLRAWEGTGTLTIQGNAVTPSNVVLRSSTGTLFAAVYGGNCIIKDCKLTTDTVGGHCLQASYGSYISFSNVDFGDCTSYHMMGNTGGTIAAIGNYSISGGATAHFASSMGGLVQAYSKTITITGTPAFSFFAVASYNAPLYIPSNTYVGSATGSRYSATYLGLIHSGVTLPGSTAGSVSNGGLYY